jgi:hypothetical protein
MNVEGALNGITKNMTKIGALAGFVSQTDGIDGVANAFMRIAKGQIHPPDISALMNGLAMSPNLKTGFMMSIAGYVLNEVVPSNFKKYAKMLKDGGLGYTGGVLASYILWFCTNANLNSDPTKADYNPNWFRNVPSLSGIQEQQLTTSPSNYGY